MPKQQAKFEPYVSQHRIRAGMSQEELARRVEVSKEIIRNIEKGTSVPNVLLGMAIAALFSIPVVELFRRKGG